MTHQARSLAAVMALLCASGAAFATNIGISPTAGPVINPLTGQETQVWKLVGKSGCSAIQLTREWIMTTKHCGPSGTFTNPLGQASVSGSACEQAPLQVHDDPKVGRDILICRLSNPSAMTPLSSYPAIVSDTRSVFTQLNANKLGRLMAYGRAAPDVLTFVGLDGIPHGFDPAGNPSGSTIPYAILGDSGGGVYWFSPTAAAPALTGMLQGGNTLIQNGTLFFTAIDTAWIVSTITLKGDVPPTVVTAAQHFTGPAGNTASALSTPPGFQGSGFNWTASWATPSPEPVTAYAVSAGKNGTLDRSFTVAAAAGNTASLNGLSADTHYVCVRPVNAVGPAPAVQTVAFSNPDTEPWGVIGISTPNCARLDLRTPTAVGTLSFTSTYTAATGLYKITATWAAPSVPELTPKYRVAQTLKYASGPSRTSTATTTSQSHSASNLQPGSQVCLTVTGYSRADVLGTPSSTQCFTAN